MDDKEKLLVKSIFRDSYNLHLKYSDMENSEKDWLALSREIRILSNKYNNNKFCDNILLAIFEDKEDKICI